jgi:hypothetical protein
MEAGNVRQTPIYSVERRVVKVELLFIPEAYAMFQSWVHYKINMGSDPFLMNLTFGEGHVDRVVQIVEGTYSANWSDPHWVVSFNLEIFNTPPIDEESLDSYLTS